MCWSAAHLYESQLHRQEQECCMRAANVIPATEAASGTHPAYSHIPMPRKMLKKSFTLQIPVGIRPAGILPVGISPTLLLQTGLHTCFLSMPSPACDVRPCH